MFESNVEVLLVTGQDDVGAALYQCRQEGWTVLSAGSESGAPDQVSVTYSR